MTWIVRVAHMTLMVCALIVAAPTSAFAHSSGQAKPTNFKSTLQSIEPQIEGIRIRSVDSGDRLELTNTSDLDVTVLGYSDEPYLRVGPQGTFVNTLSPAYYLNQELYVQGPAPQEADATKAPQWKNISASKVALWHDHRTHWMSTVLPPIVRASPDQRHLVIPSWKVSFLYGETKITASGKLEWIPGPSPLRWYGLVAIGVLAGIALAFAPSSALRLIAVGACVLIVCNITQITAAALAIAGTTSTRLANGARFIGPLFVAWVVGLYGGWRMWTRQRQLKDGEGEGEGAWLIVFAALLIAIVGGVTDFPAFSRSQIPSELSPLVARILTGISAGFGLGIALAALMVIRRRRGQGL